LSEEKKPRLKTLELQGYKTFSNRTPFEFANTITAIVGPNGSGKSNITDSIRWVLGEQSFSLLRAKKSEDMIFSGSEVRTRSGMASATITFDNSDGWLPIDFSEVAINRRAYRDGQNEYRINGQRVRLRDVSELLAQSGLAERTYTIIGQGLVDTALSLRADERRRLFEEAAGIGLFRSRREEALRRLENTNRNLDRVQDILAEINPRLKSLEHQARRAAEYEQIRLDLQVLLREWYGYHWHRVQMKLASSRETAQVQEKKLAEARLNLMEKEKETEVLRLELKSLRVNVNDWHRELSKLHRERESVNQEIAVLEERKRSLILQENSIKNEQIKSQEEKEFYHEQLSYSQNDIQQLEEDLVEAKQEYHLAENKLHSRQKERQELENKLKQLRRQLEDLRSQQVRLNTHIIERNKQVERIHQTLDVSEKKLIEMNADYQSAIEKLAKLESIKQEDQKEVQEAESNLEEQRKQLQKNESIQRELHKKRSNILSEIAGINTQLSVLEQAEKALTGYGKGTQILINAAREKRLKGTPGALSNYIEVPPELEKAISSVLGEFLEAVILQGEPLEALELLDNKVGRAAIIPISDISQPKARINLEKTANIIGIAADYVKADPAYQPIVELLLGQVIIVRNRSVARQVLEGKDSSYKAVTMKGEVFFANGPVLTSGETSLSDDQSLLGRARNIRGLKTKQKALQTEAEIVEQQIDQIETEREKLLEKEKSAVTYRNSSQSKLEQSNTSIMRAEAYLQGVEKQIEWHQEQLSHMKIEVQDAEQQIADFTTNLESIDKDVTIIQQDLDQKSTALSILHMDELQSESSHWKTMLAVAESSLKDAQNHYQEKTDSLSKIEVHLDNLQSSSQSIENEQLEIDRRLSEYKQNQSNLQDQIIEIHKRVDPAEQTINQIEQKTQESQKEETFMRQFVSAAEHHHAQSRIAIAKHQEALETLRNRIEDDFGLVSFEYVDQISGPNPLPLQGMVEELPFIEELSVGIEETIKRQRAQLKRMGAINPEAQSEYIEVSERYQFLTSQLEDLKAAQEDVRQVIKELEDAMEKEFQRTFDLVAEVFREIFLRLFGGGSAKLVLTNPDDLTNSGIDIEARLPGRRAQGLALLSGGERSLTATALIFSLLKISPTPFCVLDEVDAMLDEVNIGRFRELLRELSQNTQFVIVTHNRNTVQVADIIYGVTMGRDSVSQVLSLKLDQVPEII
jgi:chromosome segregation protein